MIQSISPKNKKHLQKRCIKKVLTINDNKDSRKAATYSPTIVVPLAQMGLTALFGMVRGEPHRYNHLKSLS